MPPKLYRLNAGRPSGLFYSHALSGVYHWCTPYSHLAMTGDHSSIHRPFPLRSISNTPSIESPKGRSRFRVSVDLFDTLHSDTL
jgi:hypothetical protein